MVYKQKHNCSIIYHIPMNLKELQTKTMGKTLFSSYPVDSAIVNAETPRESKEHTLVQISGTA